MVHASDIATQCTYCKKELDEKKDIWDEGGENGICESCHLDWEAQQLSRLD